MAIKEVPESKIADPVLPVIVVVPTWQFMRLTPQYDVIASGIQVMAP
jgi:hypothetical protein